MPALQLDRSTRQQHTGSTFPPNEALGKQGGPHSNGIHRWVDQTTTLTDFISRLEDRHRGALRGWDYSRRNLDDPLWSGPWPLQLAFQSLLGCLATDTLAIVAILGTEPPGNVILWEARKGTVIMAPRRFNEYRWYNLRQARDPDHLMKELTEIILDGLIPSEEEFVPVELDQTGGEGTPTDWTPPHSGGVTRDPTPPPLPGCCKERGQTLTLSTHNQTGSTLARHYGGPRVPLLRDILKQRTSTWRTSLRK